MGRAFLSFAEWFQTSPLQLHTQRGAFARARCAARARRLGAQRSRPSSSLSRARLSRSSLSLSLSLFFLIFFPPFSLSSKSRSPMKSVLSIFRLRNLIGDRPYIRGEGFLFKQSSGFNTRQNCATKCNFYSHIPKGGDSRAFWMKKWIAKMRHSGESNKSLVHEIARRSHDRFGKVEGRDQDLVVARCSVIDRPWRTTPMREWRMSI